MVITPSERNIFIMYQKVKVKPILELIFVGQTNTEISKALSVSRNTVIKIRSKKLELNLSYEEVKKASEDELYLMLFPDKFKKRRDYEPIDENYIHEELKKTGVTLLLLWEEYVRDCKKKGKHYCTYPTFCLHYRKYTVKKSYTSHIVRKPGETIEVDWSGPTMYFYNPETKEKNIAYLFVATLPYSQKIYVEATSKMDQENWIRCNVNMLHYYERVPLKIVCDNLKTAVIKHPSKGEVIFNEEYLTFAEYYGVAIIATNVRKPKEKPSVEGSVGKIASKIIAKLRNEKFYSLQSLNKAILIALEEFNNCPFQKRNGSRNSIYEIEEKPFMNLLPNIKYEVCSWSYSHKVTFNSHVYYKNNWYSVPHQYINEKVDIKILDDNLYIYFSNKQIADHKLYDDSIKNGFRTNKEHLPIEKEFVPWTFDRVMIEARKIGPNTLMVVEKLFNECKVKEQALNTTVPIIELVRNYSKEIIEKSSRNALRNYSLPRYEHIEELAKYYRAKHGKKEVKSSHTRGANYYKKGN